ncbi:MAG: hypothetical protein Q4G29_03035 [Pseudoscardovia radai]|nr:hypothetical protein [Pseudoscardovia radai]
MGEGMIGLVGLAVVVAVLVIVTLWLAHKARIAHARKSGDRSNALGDDRWDADYEWSTPHADSDDDDLRQAEQDWAAENDWSVKPDADATVKPEPVITFDSEKNFAGARKQRLRMQTRAERSNGPNHYGSVPRDIAYKTQNGIAPSVTREELREPVSNPDIRIALRDKRRVSDRFASGKVGEAGEEKTRRIVDEWAKRHHAIVRHGYFVNQQIKDSDVDHIIAFESEGVQHVILLDSKNYAPGIYERGRRKLDKSDTWELFLQTGSMGLAVKQLENTLLGMPFLSDVHCYTVIWCSSRTGKVVLRGFEKESTIPINGEDLPKLLDGFSDASEPNMGMSRAIEWAFSPRGKTKKTWSLGMEREEEARRRRENGEGSGNGGSRGGDGGKGGSRKGGARKGDGKAGSHKGDGKADSHKGDGKAGSRGNGVRHGAGGRRGKRVVGNSRGEHSAAAQIFADFDEPMSVLESGMALADDGASAPARDGASKGAVKGAEEGAEKGAKGGAAPGDAKAGKIVAKNNDASDASRDGSERDGVKGGAPSDDAAKAEDRTALERTAEAVEKAQKDRADQLRAQAEHAVMAESGAMDQGVDGRGAKSGEKLGEKPGSAPHPALPRQKRRMFQKRNRKNNRKTRKSH